MVSIFLAKIIGLYMLIVGILCIVRKQQIMTMGKELFASRITLAVSAEISLIFGIIIAVDHSIWELSWRGLITLIGYLLILKGIIRFAYPEFAKKFASKIWNKGYWVCCLITLIVGIYLTYCGFHGM
jgi:uncharacterized membrane protein HdeD (DUF308 family)